MMYKNIIVKLLIFVCLIIFLISISILIKDFIAYEENNDATEQLIQNVIEVDETEEKNHINWQELNEINSDIIAWIEIENTNINYPILRDSNSYYLNHSYDKKYNKNGSIFTTNTNPFVDAETIIYGHNMKNGTMFSELGKYLKKDFLDTHNCIKIYTPNGDYEGTIISAYSIGIDIENNTIKSLDFNERIEYYKRASKYTVENIDNINKIVKLSTCSYLNAKTSPTDQRYYIIASIIPI